MRLLLTTLVCLSMIADAAAQRKCDSVFTIRVFDSLTHKPLQYATVQFDKSDKHQLIVSPTNKKGRAKFYLPQKIDADKNYLFRVAQTGYDTKENIPLNLDCKCRQKVYLRHWDETDTAKLNKTTDYHHLPKPKRR